MNEPRVSFYEVGEWFAEARNLVVRLAPPEGFRLHDHDQFRFGFSRDLGPLRWRAELAPSANPPGLRPFIAVEDLQSSDRAACWVGFPRHASRYLHSDLLTDAGVGGEPLTVLGRSASPSDAVELLSGLLTATLPSLLRDFGTRESLLRSSVRFRAERLPHVETASSDLSWSLLRPSMYVSLGLFKEAHEALPWVEVAPEFRGRLAAVGHFLERRARRAALAGPTRH